MLHVQFVRLKLRVFIFELRAIAMKLVILISLFQKLFIWMTLFVMLIVIVHLLLLLFTVGADVIWFALVVIG